MYPNCLADWRGFIGDGYCDLPLYELEECAFDGGDCDEFKRKYPKCEGELPNFIGDGNCNGGDYNTEECGFDGGDCD